MSDKKYICVKCIEKGEHKTKPIPSTEEMGEVCSVCNEKGLVIDYITKTKKKPKKKKKEDNKKYSSCIIDDERETIAEQVYDGESKFCFYDSRKGEVKYYNSLWDVNDARKDYLPLDGEEVEKKAILLPTEAIEYGSEEELDIQIKNFINKWLDVDEDYIQFALWNIKRSWVYERFHTLNYLRALGDTGQGKSRFLDTLGYLHYKPIATSGATTSAPIFRIINKWKGTLIIDEADFAKSDEAQDIIKIINQGYESGKHIMRCDKDDSNKVNFFDPYCPKILATRRTFTDKAVESRCITQVMKGTMRQDIPWNLNNSFWREAQEIRNKLLMWRFRNFFKIDGEKEIDIGMNNLEPRVKQIVSSFVNLFGGDDKQLEIFKEFIIKYQEDLIDERQNSFAGQIVGAIHSLLENGIENISTQDIINEGEITDFKGNPAKPRSLSSTLRALGFEKAEQKKVDGKNKRCLPISKVLCELLFKRYGYKNIENIGNEVTVVTQYMETPQNKTKPKTSLDSIKVEKVREKG